MHDIPLRQVRAVIAVCEEGSFTRAAERENATQSGISQHVAAVERKLGVKLFERVSGRVVPTPAGLRYYKSCVGAVGVLEKAVEQARTVAGEVSWRSSHRSDADLYAGGVGACARRFRAALSGSAPAHCRGL